MKSKDIVIVLIVALILASCGTAVKVVPTETAIFTKVTESPTSSPTETATTIPVPMLTNFPDIPAPGVELVNQAIEKFASTMQQDNQKIDLTYRTGKGKDGTPFVVGVTQDGYPLVMAKQRGNEWTWKEASLHEIADSLEFLVGTNLRTPFKAREIPESIARQSQVIAGTEFNLALLDEYAYWFYSEYERDSHDFEPFAKDLSIATSYQMTARGYHVLYGCNEFQWIDWLKNGNFDKATLSVIIENHTRAFVGEFKGKINGWAVVNEVNRSDGCDQYYQIIGQDYVTIAFRAAREADPNAYLLYAFDENAPNGSADPFTLSMIKNLKEQGLVDALDLQFHLMGTDQGFDKQKIIESLLKYSEVGVPIDIGELDIRIRNVSGTDSERFVKQAALYRTVIEAAFESGVVRSISFWEASFGDQYNWLVKDAAKLGVDNDWNSTRNSPTLYIVNEQGRIVPKPALYEVRKVFLEQLVGNSQ